MSASVRLDGRTLTPHAVAAIARGASPILDPAARRQMVVTTEAFLQSGRTDVLRSKWSWLVGGPVPAAPDAAIRAFVEGHCAGVGPPLAVSEVRALMAVRANALVGGRSGVRPDLVDRILAMLDRGWIPVVPSLGSVGAAGCIALAHVARVVLGLGGEVSIDGDRHPALPRIAELPPLDASEKEALSMINGSSLTSSLGALAVADAHQLLSAAEAATALSMEVVRADSRALDPRAAAARGHTGIRGVTARLATLVSGSQCVSDKRDPDSFSVRCAPSVLGAAHDAIAHTTSVVSGELNAPADNPMVFSGELVEGGHFHGAPVALAMDHLKAALVQVAGISERRTFRLTYGALSGLPSFLVPGSGVNSGLMLAQYTAASLTSEAKLQAAPASIDNIPTVQHQEDHVPMGPGAARSALAVLDLVADVIAIELLCGAQGLDFRLDAGIAPAPRTRGIYAAVRARVPRLVDDRPLHPDLAAVGRAVRDGVFSGPPSRWDPAND